MCKFASAVITKYHKLNDLNNRNSFYNSGSWKFVVSRAMFPLKALEKDFSQAYLLASHSCLVYDNITQILACHSLCVHISMFKFPSFIRTLVKLN